MFIRHHNIGKVQNKFHRLTYTAISNLAINAIVIFSIIVINFIDVIYPQISLYHFVV